MHLRDAKSSHARVAETLGAGSTDTPSAADVDLVVVAVPPRALATVVREALETYPNAAVTDVGSVKAEVLGTVWGHRDLHRYVGSHPMAGTQHSGPTAARPDLFADRTWVITPHRRSDGDRDPCGHRGWPWPAAPGPSRWTSTTTTPRWPGCRTCRT